jgi:hypothetical protein
VVLRLHKDSTRKTISCYQGDKKIAKICVKNDFVFTNRYNVEKCSFNSIFFFCIVDSSEACSRL